jgi:hypothetical protein
MNIVNIIDEIEKVDSDVIGRLNPRRAAMKEVFNFSKKAAVAAIPLGLGSMFNKASAQTGASDTVVAALQFVLALKHFEFALLTQGLAKVTFDARNAASDKVALNQIRDQEANHIAALTTAISGAGKTPVVAKTTYDFTAGGTYTDIFKSNRTFLKVAQGIKDTVIRAIKGQAPALFGTGAYLEAALAIHAVDARHSAKLRLMRLFDGYSKANKPWLSELDQTENENIGKDVFAGEDTVMQAGFDVTALTGSAVTHAQATEAFDEPLTMQAVLSALAPFKFTV